MHNPIYNSNVGHHRETTTLLLKKWAEPLFIKHKVDAVFAGHVHAYERNSGVAYGEASDTAPIYITLGNGGNHEGLYDEWLPAPVYSRFRDGRYYGHGDLKVYNRTHLKWTWTPNPEQGDILPVDEAWIAPRELAEQASSSSSSSSLLHQEQQGKGAGSAGIAKILKAAVVPVGIVGLLAGLGFAGVAYRKMYSGEDVRVSEPLLQSSSNA